MAVRHAARSLCLEHRIWAERHRSAVGVDAAKTLVATRSENIQSFRHHTPILESQHCAQQSTITRTASANAFQIGLASRLGRPFNMSRSNIMSKSQRSNREAKKQSLLTPKQKKAAKQAKKHAGDVVPFIVKGS